MSIELLTNQKKQIENDGQSIYLTDSFVEWQMIRYSLNQNLKNQFKFGSQNV